MRRPCLPSLSWSTAMTSRLVRMSWIVGVMLRRSFPARRGAAWMDHRLMWGAVFVVGHAAVADFEHVGIVPVAGLGERGECVLPKADGGHGIPSIADVAGGTPSVAADFGSPLPNIGAA